MDSYISINGNKIELSESQIQLLKEIKLISYTDVTIDELSEIVKSGEARKHFEVNDILTLKGEEYRIIGFDHDADNSITLINNVIKVSRRMNDGASPRGWIDTELRKYLNDEYYSQLPQILRDHIIPVEKVNHDAAGCKLTTIDKLFPLSESELFGSAIYSDDVDGERYEGFSTSENRRVKNECDEWEWYWERSPLSGGAAIFCRVHSDGAPSYGTASCSCGVVAGFCFR